LSTKPSSTPQSRKSRRAAERRDRFDSARDQRRSRATTTSTSSSWLTTRNITIGAIAIGIVLIALVAYSQLGGKGSTASLKDPGFDYPAAIQDGNALGSATAPAVLEVWGDFQCPICARHAMDIEPMLVNPYVIQGKLRIVHHDIDILGRGGSESRLAAIGGYCAKAQNKYWNFSHWVWANQQGENQGAFTRDRLVQMADNAGLDAGAFTTCLDSQAAADAVAATQAQSEQLGINQTPTMFLNGTRYVGLKTADDWGALIDAEIAKASAGPAASPAGSAPAPAPSASAAP
jgi:protein-disulfide isomerase